MNSYGKYFIYFLIISAISLRLYKLGSYSFWVDESFTWNVAKNLAFKELVRDRLQAGHFPFYFLFMKLWLKLFGDSEFSLRLPSFLASIFSVIFFYKLVRKNLTSKIAIFWSIFVFFYSTYSIEISQEARMYSFALLFWILLYYFILDIKNKHSLISLFSYSLILFLFLLNGSIVVLPYLGILVFLILEAKKRVYRKVLYVHILIFVLFLPLFILIFLRSQFIDINLYHIKFKFDLKTQLLLCLGWVLRFFKEISGLSWINIETIPYNLTVFYLAVFSLFIIFYFLGFINQDTGNNKLMVLTTLVSFMPFIFSYRFESRYLFFLLPLVSLSWAKFISSLYSRNKICSLVFLFLWLNIYILDIKNYYSSPKISWAEVTNLIQGKEKKGEQIWLFPRLCYPAFKYYYKGGNQIVRISPYTGLEQKVDTNIWYVVWSNVRSPWIGGAEIDKYLRNYISSFLRLEMIKCFQARKGMIEVFYYVKKS